MHLVDMFKKTFKQRTQIVLPGKTLVQSNRLRGLCIVIIGQFLVVLG